MLIQENGRNLTGLQVTSVPDNKFFIKFITLKDPMNLNAWCGVWWLRIFSAQQISDIADIAAIYLPSQAPRLLN